MSEGRRKKDLEDWIDEKARSSLEIQPIFKEITDHIEKILQIIYKVEDKDQRDVLFMASMDYMINQAVFRYMMPVNTAVSTLEVIKLKLFANAHQVIHQLASITLRRALDLEGLK